MLDEREKPLADEQNDNYETDEFIKRKSPCTIFLGYTSNMASCGVREYIRYLVQHKMVKQNSQINHHYNLNNCNKIFNKKKNLFIHS